MFENIVQGFWQDAEKYRKLRGNMRAYYVKESVKYACWKKKSKLREV